MSFMPDRSRGNILLIDRQPETLTQIGAMLRAEGYRLSMAFDGQQGYERAIAGRPDLILMDTDLGRLDGTALCRRLKNHHVTQAIPIIIYSHQDSVQERVHALRNGAVDYINKNCSPMEVLARIDIHISLARGATRNTGDSSGPAPAGDDDYVLVVALRQYLASHLGEAHTLKDLAAVVGVHGRRLTQAFRNHLNMSVSEYLRQQRMETAERLLTQTALRVVAVGEEVGFSSAANFSTAFRRHTGMSPSAYRRRALMGQSAFDKHGSGHQHGTDNDQHKD